MMSSAYIKMKRQKMPGFFPINSQQYKIDHSKEWINPRQFKPVKVIVPEPEKMPPISVNKRSSGQQVQKTKEPPKKRVKKTVTKPDESDVFDQEGGGPKSRWNMISPIQQAVLQAKALVSKRKRGGKCKRKACKQTGKSIMVRKVRRKRRKIRKRKHVVSRTRHL